MRIRTQFAAPFVLIVATACGGKSPPHKNPPPPKADAAALGCDQHKEGDACETGASCQGAATDGCGPATFTCTEGKWVKVAATCNPPPPKAE